jgi:hypothetical protein
MKGYYRTLHLLGFAFMNVCRLGLDNTHITGICFRIKNNGLTGIFGLQVLFQPNVTYSLPISKFGVKGGFIGGTFLKCLYLVGFTSVRYILTQ